MAALQSTFSYSEPSFEDTADFADADRGFIMSLKPCIIKHTDGTTIWNNDYYDFVNQGSCPNTVNPKLWRQAQLLSKQGLYRISPSIYQVRGLDISHITFVEGETGVIVIDPLISCECAAAAWKLYQGHRGIRPVKAVIYTHSHVDHYGGAAGVLPPSNTDKAPDNIPIIAPEGFLEEVTSENIFAGPIMKQRARHMYGSSLPKSPTGNVGVGLAMATSQGTVSLIPPTVDIRYTGQTLDIDTIPIVFQMVPNTEAPAEMNLYFPSEKVLLVAECATHALHNIVTLRGALVRDAKAWGKYLDETLMLYCEQAGAEVLFGSHSWPTWGNERIRKFLEEQRDLYAYMHDQTVRQMNAGLNGTEIAEGMILPPKLRRAWHTQGFYGSLSHNVKGIYQRYMTWFDGGAENLWKWPPKEAGTRYVQCMGGAEGVLDRAEVFIEKGDYRFAASLLGHLVAAGEDVGGSEPAQIRGREMLASVFQQLGFGAENATWRNYYLSQCLDLKSGQKPRGRNSATKANFQRGLSVEQWLGLLSINIDGVRAGKEEQTICIDIHVQDEEERWILILSNGALSFRSQAIDQQLVGLKAGLVLRLDKSELHATLSGSRDPADIQVASGDRRAFAKILSFAGIKRVSEKTQSHL